LRRKYKKKGILCQLDIDHVGKTNLSEIEKCFAGKNLSGTFKLNMTIKPGRHHERCGDCFQHHQRYKNAPMHYCAGQAVALPGNDKRIGSKGKYFILCPPWEGVGGEIFNKVSKLTLQLGMG
jgi:hypothetical protein